MASLFATEFYHPQLAPPAPPSFNQTTEDPEWYGQQRASSVQEYASRKPARSSFTLTSFSEQRYLSRDFMAELRSLQRHYTVLGSDRLVIALLEEEPGIYALMREAVNPLKNAFGEGRIVQVRPQFSDDDSLLRVAVQLPATFRDDAERALRSFDEEWWLNNCSRSGGTLVFDYEIQDAV